MIPLTSSVTSVASNVTVFQANGSKGTIGERIMWALFRRNFTKQTIPGPTAA